MLIPGSIDSMADPPDADRVESELLVELFRVGEKRRELLASMPPSPERLLLTTVLDSSEHECHRLLENLALLRQIGSRP